MKNILKKIGDACGRDCLNRVNQVGSILFHAMGTIASTGRAALVLALLALAWPNAAQAYDYTLVLTNGVAYKNSVAAENIVDTSSMGLTYAGGVWTMNGFSFVTTADYGVKVKGETTIKVAGNNTIVSGNLTGAGANSYGLAFWDDSVLTSDSAGTLTVTSGTATSSMALTTIKCLTVSGDVKVNAVAEESSMSVGLGLAAADPESEETTFSASFVVRDSAQVTVTTGVSDMSVALFAYGPVAVFDNAVLVCTADAEGCGYMGIAAADGIAKKTGTSTVLPFDEDNSCYLEGDNPATDITFGPTAAEILYTEPVYKTPGEPTSGIDHWVTNAVADFTVVDSSTTTWGESGETTWYAVTNASVTISGQVTCVGDVRLILCEGAALTVSGGEYEAGVKTTDASLTIYGQPDGAGTLNANAGRYAAGIGGGYYSAGGTVTINGGTVFAYGGYEGAGIGGGEYARGGTITINGGTVEAEGGDYAAGIGGGYDYSGEYFTLNDGTVTVYGGSYAAGIGGGSYGYCGEVLIAGGVLTAVGGYNCGAIGDGSWSYSYGSVVFTGGEQYLTAGEGARGVFETSDGYAPSVSVADGLWTFDVETDWISSASTIFPMVDAKYTCCVAPKSAGYLAQCGTNFYPTVAAAFAAIEDGCGVSVYTNLCEAMTVPAGCSIVFSAHEYGVQVPFVLEAGASYQLVGGKYSFKPAAEMIPNGYHVLDNRGADRVEYPYYVRYAEASVTREKTTIYYDSISDALKECTAGDVITVLKGGEVGEIVPAVPGIILDLNGYAITNATSDQAVKIVNVSLTIRDSMGGGRLVGTREYGVLLQNGTLTVEGGTVEGSSAGVFVSGSYNYKYTSTVNVSGGKIVATQDGYPAISSAPYTHLNISGGSFAGYVQTYLETDAIIAQYATPNGMTRSSVDLSDYSGDTIVLRVIGCPSSSSPTPGIAFATGVAYQDLIEPADEQGRTGTAAFGGAMSFSYSNVAKTWAVAAPPVALTWVDADGTTPIPGMTPTEATKNSQITLPVAYKEGYLLTGWSGSTPQTTYTVTGSTTFRAAWTAVPFAGSGSPTDPFRISNLVDLTNLVAYANAGGIAARRVYATFGLTANIDVSSIENWTPIARNGDYYWNATFDGGGHAISNLRCVGTEYLGLFGYISGGSVRNLTVANVAVTNNNQSSYSSSYGNWDYTTSYGAGAVAGWMCNGAIVSNCTVSGTVFANFNCCAIAPSVIGTKILDCDTTALKDEIDKEHTNYAGYTTTNMCGWIEKGDYAMDVIGRAKGNWVKTTYANGGYRYRTYGLGDATVTQKCVPMSGGKFTKFIYTVTAGTQPIVGGRIGLGADTQIGDQDGCMLGVIRDSDGNVMGLRMVNDRTSSAIGNDQYNLYFRGVAGCTDAATYWFGYYGDWDENWMNQLDQSNANGDYRFDENGEYESLVNTDSGLALSWEVNLEPGKTATYACAFGIGEKADPPRWYTDLELTKDGRTINADAKVTNEAGLKVMLYAQCAPDKFGGEKLFDTQRALGEDDPIDMHGTIDTTGWEDGLYVFTFWTVNEYGAMSESKRIPIQIKDGEIILDIGGEGYYLIEGEVISKDKEQFSDYAVKVVALGDSTTEYPSVITKDGYFYAVTPKGEYNVIVTAYPADPALNPVESIVLVHVENDTQDVRMELSDPTDRSINSKLVDLTAPTSQFHGFLVGDLEQVAQKLAETITEGDFTLSIIGEDADGTAPHADEMRTLGVRGDRFRDISYVKFGFSVSNDVGVTAQDTVPRTATVVLPFLYARSGELEVYRWNDNVGMMEAITAVPNAAGEYFEVYSDDAVLVRIVKGGLYGLAYNLDRHLTVDGVDIGLAQGLGWTCVSNELVFTGAGEYTWRGTNDVPLKSVNAGGAYILFTAGETQVQITNVTTRPTWLPQGYAWEYDPVTEIGRSREFDAVARIVVDKDYPNLYETLDEAVAAADADGRTVTVLRDCAFTALNVSGIVTLDGEENTITGDPATITVAPGAEFRIVGGTYNFDPNVSGWVPEGYGVNNNGDGTWTVWGTVKVTLIANWGGRFEGGFPSEETNEVKVVRGGNLADVVAPIPTNGMYFAGWYKDSQCKKQQITDKPINEASTFYAGYGYQVVFDATGGVFDDGQGTKTETILKAYGSFPTPMRAGYTLLGWYDAITNGANEVTAATLAGDCTVYARWKATKNPAGGAGFSGTDTPDGQGVTDVKPNGAYTTGDIVIPERVNNTATGKAIVSIARSAFTPAQYERKLSAPAIKSVTIPTFVTEIKNYAFCQNPALTNVTFSPVYDYKTGEKTTLYIRDYAFANTAITELVFPAGGTYKLGYNAFSQNPNLTDIWIYGKVTVESLDKSPFREVGEGLGAGEKVNFHISPSQALDKDFVYALTNGVNAAHVVADVDTRESGAVLGEVPVDPGQVTFGDPIVVTFTLPADAPWQTVTTDNVYFLYAENLADLTVERGRKLQPYEVTPKGGNQYEAKFVKPSADQGYFRLFVGE